MQIFFELKRFRIIDHIRQTKVLMVNFPKILLAYLSKNYASLYMILLHYDGVHKVDKIPVN